VLQKEKKIPSLWEWSGKDDVRMFKEDEIDESRVHEE
jgi:hypothetical protein